MNKILFLTIISSSLFMVACGANNFLIHNSGKYIFFSGEVNCDSLESGKKILVVLDEKTVEAVLIKCANDTILIKKNGKELKYSVKDVTKIGENPSHFSPSQEFWDGFIVSALLTLSIGVIIVLSSLNVK